MTMTPAQERALADLVDRQSSSRNRIRTQVLSTVERAWGGLGSWDEADVERFVNQVAPLIRAGQLQTANLTDGFIANAMAELTGEPVRPVGLPPEEVSSLRPVPVDEVYRRPFVEVWSGLKNGQRFDDALGVGRDRLLRLVDDDLSLAHRTAASRASSGQGVQRYRRVLRPYMAKGGTCGLCIAASDQRYHSDNLLPIHTRCHCEVLPIVGDEDPGRVFNGQDIPTLYKRAAAQSASGSGRDLKKVRVKVHEHGELGPTLTEAGADFTGPGDVAA